MKQFFVALSFILHCQILLAQNLGVGTTAPLEKLHVAGNIKADTIKPNALKLTLNAAPGKLLTSDASGNATWQQNSSSAAGNIGFGAWGDCATNANLTEYQPVANDTATGSFGNSVFISGNYAIIGTYQDKVGNNNQQGSASIYQFDGNHWIVMQTLTDPNGLAFDQFGFAVSISASYAIVGTPFQEYACIYQYSGGSWTLMQKITDATGVAGDFFGVSVSISGNYAIIGANTDDGPGGADQGSVSIYQYNGTSWVLMQKIMDATGLASDHFGNSVSISGNYVIIGAPLDDAPGRTDEGSASVYQYNGSSWVLMLKLIAPLTAAGDNFGSSVSISGNYAIIGTPSDDIPGGNTDQGSANVYRYNGTNWVWMELLTDTDGVAGDDFGSSVFISGDYAIVGAYGVDASAFITQKGAAIIYLRVGLGWQKVQYVTDPAGKGNDRFGGAVAIDGNSHRFLLGANGYAAVSGKVVFGKVN